MKALEFSINISAVLHDLQTFYNQYEKRYKM